MVAGEFDRIVAPGKAMMIDQLLNDTLLLAESQR